MTLNQDTIDQLNALGKFDEENSILSLAITDEQFDLDDDDEDSIVSQVEEITGPGYIAEHTNYTEPREDGKTDIEIKITALPTGKFYRCYNTGTDEQCEGPYNSPEEARAAAVEDDDIEGDQQGQYEIIALHEMEPWYRRAVRHQL